MQGQWATQSMVTQVMIQAHRGVNVSNTTSPMRLSMMLGVGLGYMPWPPDGPLAGDGSGVSLPSATERRFSAGLAGGGAARASALVSKGSGAALASAMVALRVIHDDDDAHITHGSAAHSLQRSQSRRSGFQEGAV